MYNKLDNFILGCSTSARKTAVYQSGVWTTSHRPMQDNTSPEGWGWTKEVNWKPVWLTIPEAARACSELIIIKCGCKSNQGCMYHLQMCQGWASMYLHMCMYMWYVTYSTCMCSQWGGLWWTWEGTEA